MDPSFFIRGGWEDQQKIFKMEEIPTKIKINKRMVKAALQDVNADPGPVTLFYVNDRQPGFTRIKENDKFVYMDGDEVLTDPEHLERIKKLVLPPAWEKVWICKIPNGHLQATGYDQLNRKQYRYHNYWSLFRNHTKFFRIQEFGKQLPQIRAQLEKDLALPEYPQEKVLAAVVSLMERTNIRIGNAFYEKLYGSFGLTTLKDRHVRINGQRLHFSFKGKKGIKHEIDLRSKKLARIVQGCKDIPGKELFQYYDENGNIGSVDSGMVNNYIKNISGGDFTAKDFRTWAGTVQAILAFKDLGGFMTVTEMNKKIPAAFDLVASQLGNTRSVCKKYYVHPIIIELYREKKLQEYIDELDLIETDQVQKGLTAEEAVLLKILEKYTKV
jgi:DNA topoisomerase-1